MKKGFVTVIIAAWMLSLSLISPNRSGGTAAMQGQGNTGAPCDNGNVCGSCHFGGLLGPTTQSITLIDTVTSLEVASYLPGKTYDVEIKVIKGRASSFPQAYGFQATALGPDTTQAGTWLNPEGVVHLITLEDDCGRNRTYAEHSAASFSSTFRLQWRAPWSARDSVTFYFVGNATNLNGSTAGDNGGFGDNRVYPPAGVNHLILTGDDVTSGDFYAVDSITLDANVQSGAKVNLSAQKAVRVLPQSTVPVDASIEVFVGGE